MKCFEANEIFQEFNYTETIATRHVKVIEDADKGQTGKTQFVNRVGAVGWHPAFRITSRGVRLQLVMKFCNKSWR